ncbi:hypothetical protein GGR54DRAFT_654405 [Hypoxylon sp. NC1633]|nr:hypothetical protein GGR54DRAFT_654405 [Hypoxylon sp. NC1633]
MKRYVTGCLILAVVPAHDASPEKMLSEVRRYNQDNTRTLGIITRPDLPTSNSNDHKDFVRFVQNSDESVHTAILDWHILRNRSDTEVSDTNQQRDQKEASFLQSSCWSGVSPRNLGAQSLRMKLNGILLDYSKRAVQNLSEVREKSISERESRLTLVGKPRSTVSAFLAYLDQLASRFHHLCLQAIEGNYDDEFFGGQFPEHELSWLEDNKIMKLHALLRKHNLAFLHVLNTKGSKYIILHECSSAAQPKVTLPNSLEGLVGQYEIEEPLNITFEELAARLQPLVPYWQGCEFPGSVNDTLAVKLFQDQSQPWEGIARRHIELILSMTKEFVKKLVFHIADPDLNACSRIISKIVEPFFEAKSTVLESRLQELLRHYKGGYLQVPDTDFRALLAQKRQESGNIDQIRDLFKRRPELFTQEAREALGKRGQSKGEYSEIRDIIYKSEIYYEMSVRTFVNNVVILAVENCLIRDLPSIIADKVKQMTDDEVEQLMLEAAEM